MVNINCQISQIIFKHDAHLRSMNVQFLAINSKKVFTLQSSMDEYANNRFFFMLCARYFNIENQSIFGKIEFCGAAHRG